jgi:hypothetical protein
VISGRQRVIQKGTIASFEKEVKKTRELEEGHSRITVKGHSREENWKGGS